MSTIRRLLAAASDETRPLRPQPAARQPNQSAALVPSRYPAPPAAPRKSGERRIGGTPRPDRYEERAAGRRAEAAPPRALRPAPQPQPAARRQADPRPAQGAAPHPANQRAQSATSHQCYQEALDEALQQAAAADAKRRASIAQARRQQAAVQARLEGALTDAGYKAPPPERQPVRAPQKQAKRRSQQLARRRPQAEKDAPQQIFAGVIRSVKWAVLAAGLFSLFTTMLMLAGPFYLLQVYDRVLASGINPALVALGVLLVVLYGTVGLLEMLRGRILNRIAGRLESRLSRATLEALPRHRPLSGGSAADDPTRDLASLRQFISGSGPAIFFDLPGVPIFLLIITMMHWSLGMITAIGMLIMALIAASKELRTRALLREGRKAAEEAASLARESGGTIEATDAILVRWHQARQRAEMATRKAGDRVTAFASTAKFARMSMQTVLLAWGALLVSRHEISSVIGQEISSGMMIAVSIMAGKALGPIGLAVVQWRGLLNALDAFGRLKSFHKRHPAEVKLLLLSAPKGRIEVRSLRVTPPGSELPVLNGVSFVLEAGRTLGVIGASTAGKTALADALAGVRAPDIGSVRLDSTELRICSRDELGRKVGYLPQAIELFDGTIAENIARFHPDATRDAIIKAAETVGVHKVILDLPGGYGFKVGEDGSGLSGRQRRCIGLARAVLGDPALVVLDEPNAAIDALGKAALHRALNGLKASRTTVILITRRVNALDAVDQILLLENGAVREFGKSSKVLKLLARDDSKPIQAAPAVAATQKPQPKITALPRQEGPAIQRGFAAAKGISRQCPVPAGH